MKERPLWESLFCWIGSLYAEMKMLMKQAFNGETNYQLVLTHYFAR